MRLQSYSVHVHVEGACFGLARVVQQCATSANAVRRFVCICTRSATPQKQQHSWGLHATRSASALALLCCGTAAAAAACSMLSSCHCTESVRGSCKLCLWLRQHTGANVVAAIAAAHVAMIGRCRHSDPSKSCVCWLALFI